VGIYFTSILKIYPLFDPEGVGQTISGYRPASRYIRLNAQVVTEPDESIKEFCRYYSSRNINNIRGVKGCRICVESIVNIAFQAVARGTGNEIEERAAGYGESQGM
jgi:hypothetical protein